MCGLTTRIKAILLLCGIALGGSACAVYEPAPYYYSAPGYSYYPPAGYGYYGAPAYGYSPSVVVGGGGWWHGGGRRWR